MNLDALTVMASVLAVCISVYALKVQRNLGHETSTQTLIHAQYELCRVLDRLRVEYPEVSHMLALPSLTAQRPGDTWQNYYLFKNHVRRLLEEKGPITEAARGRLYLQEHATALHVYDIYEQTFLQWDLAQEAGDKKRAKVLQALVQYYEARMLRSPRLRFHWDHGASDMMEQLTRDRYEEKVRRAHPDDPVDDKSPLED